MIRLRNGRSEILPLVSRIGGTINTVRGAWASAVIYSVTETAGANGLNMYYYIKYLLEQLAALMDEQGNIEHSKLKPLMP